MRAATWSSSATSHGTPSTWCPAAVSSSVTDVSAAWLMSASTTAAPASANARAVARPMPELAPVTRATWPVKSYLGFIDLLLFAPVRRCRG